MNGKLDIRKSKKYLVFDYQNNNQVNNLLNDWYDSNRLIIFDKKDDNIVIKLEKLEYNVSDKEVILGDNLNKIIDLLDIAVNVRINVKGDDIKLYSNNYKSILDNLLLKNGDCYIFDISKENKLYKEIAKYNKYLNMVNIKDIDKTFKNFTIADIKDCINSNTNNIVVLNDNNMIKLYIDDGKNCLFVFNDRNMFDNIFLPEILNMYGSMYDKSTMDEVKYFNNNYGKINDNFYFINFKEEEIQGWFNYFCGIVRKNDYKLDLDSNYTFIKKEITTNKRYNYSYGYISLLFISLIISVITIVIVFMNL
ncbi:MAG: hypothetical protein IKF19_05095 [Bacilli bacterium]|nr:hypothetical protein [Bacilli bacterium]